jgi:SAM-dependent methyltransferase
VSNPFGTDHMAMGYARARPAVHPRVMDLVFTQLGRSHPVPRALDVGCGAGISTRALEGFALHRVGLEPAVAMLRWAASTAPGAAFVAGAAESLPIRDRSIDLISAAGSLNYVDLARFFPEAARVLARGGVLVVYDFEAGRSFAASDDLDAWFERFLARYPYPTGERRPLSPEILGGLDHGFAVLQGQSFAITLELTPEFYLAYVLTETNVAAAARNGPSAADVRAWCAESLRPVWGGRAHEVVFRGYFACLAPL